MDGLVSLVICVGLVQLGLLFELMLVVCSVTHSPVHTSYDLEG